MKSLYPQDISPMQLQGILQNAVSPRPIALASTVNKSGDVNLSPFSFYNVFSSNPPILIFSPARRVRDNTTKHTLENVLEVPEVVIGVVNYAMVQQVSLSSTEYAEGVNEFVKSGLTMKKSELVRPPLIAESPVNFECRVVETKPLGTGGGAGNLVICEVLQIHLKEEFLNDDGTLNQIKLDVVARLGGNWYSRNTKENLFEVPKPLVSQGIGYDELPVEIKNSTVFTGNDLGMLSNVESLPGTVFFADEDVHRKAQKLLIEQRIEEAWDLLIVKS